MPNNWKETLEARAAGEVPGFIGVDESVEDFAVREAAHKQSELEAAAQPVTTGAVQGSAVAEAIAAAKPRTPRKAPAKKRTARKTTAKRR